MEKISEINNIKVKAEYIVDSVDELETLLNQYELAKQITQETKTKLTPIIMAEGKAKYDAIMEQLQPIITSLQKLAVSRMEPVELCCYYGQNGEFYIKAWKDDDYKITYSRYKYEFDFEKNKGALCSPTGLITHWNEYNIIDKLKQALKNKIRGYIESEEYAKTKIETNYEAMHS